MKQYFSNGDHNKAAYLLALMSPDIVEDIVDLVNSRGHALVGDLFQNDDEGPARPLAIFSRDYISNEDAPALAVGISGIILASLRNIKADADFYQSVLQGAFALPVEIARPMAQKIETYDILGGPNGDKDAWYTRIGRQLQEGIRRTVNLLPRFFGSTAQNDQDQSYDLDFLYEATLLGKGIDEMMSRMRLMRGQATIAKQMNLFVSVDKLQGDVYGDVYGDPDEIAELKLSDAVKPLVGGPLPMKIMGGLAKLIKAGFGASQEKVAGLASQAGVGNTAGQTVDPHMSAAWQKMTSGDNSSIVGQLDGQNVSLDQMKKALEVIKVARSTGQTGDVYGEIAETYGDAISHHWKNGDVPGLMTSIIDQAEGPLPTTGDPELDAAIIADTLGDIEEQYGDVDIDGTEIGGLLKRVRIKHAIKKGNKRKRKNDKFAAKQRDKNVQAKQLRDAKSYAAGQITRQQANEMFSEEDDGGGQVLDQSMETDPEFNTGYTNDASDQQDDLYNVNALV